MDKEQKGANKAKKYLYLLYIVQKGTGGEEQQTRNEPGKGGPGRQEVYEQPERPGVPV